MRSIAFVLVTAVITSGCAQTPAYLVQPEHLHEPVAAATRERDGQAVRLRGGSFMPTEEPPMPDGRVRVRGPGRRGSLWKAGLAVTVIGWGLAITGAALGITGVTRTICSDFRRCADSPSTREGDRMFIAGITIGPIGDAMTLIGPALMIAGARQKPVELDGE